MSMIQIEIWIDLFFAVCNFSCVLPEFSLGAVRGFEGTTQRGQGEVRDAHIPPFPFRFFHSRQFRFAKLRSLLRKRALPFPDSLSPLVHSASVYCITIALRSQERSSS